MFQEVESAIIERLRATLPASTQVTTFAELSRVPEYRNKAPAVFVVYDGFAPADSPANVPTLQQIELRFTVVVTTKSAAGNGGGTAARDESGDIAKTVIEALIGLRVDGGRYLRLSTAPGAEYDAGYSYTPIGFVCLKSFKAMA
jgi:phage gp37-like protein